MNHDSAAANAEFLEQAKICIDEAPRFIYTALLSFESYEQLLDFIDFLLKCRKLEIIRLSNYAHPDSVSAATEKG